VSSDREIYANNLDDPALKHFTYARDYKPVFYPIKNALKKAQQAKFEHGERPEVV